jgi:hypothetical protein
VAGLQALFADDVELLRDWDVEKKGADPEVAIEVLMTHCSPETAVCEVFVNLNNDDGTVLKVVGGRRDRLQQRRRKDHCCPLSAPTTGQ